MHFSYVFFGQHAAFSYRALDLLVHDAWYPLAVVVARKHLPRGPQQHWKFSQAESFVGAEYQGPFDLRPLCAKFHIDVIETNRVNDLQLLSQVSVYRPDLFVVVGFDCLFEKELLAIPRLGAVNVHPSLLPRWRGPTPFFWIFREGDWEASGVTLHHMDKRADHGPVIMQKKIPRERCSDVDSYLIAAGELGGRCLIDMLASNQQTLPPGREQRHDRACRAPRPRPADLVIDPTKWSGARLQQFVNGVCGRYTPTTELGHDRFFLQRVLEFRPGKQLYGHYALKGDTLYVPVADGLAVCQVFSPLR